MPNVVVLGSSGYDLTIALDRLPRPGERLLGGTLHQAPGGKGANQAIASRRAGARVSFITAFGDDAFGQKAAENCRNEGLDLSHAKTVTGAANQVALILVGEGGQNLIAVAPGASLALSPEDIDGLPDSLFAAGDILLASLEVPVPTVARALQRARQASMITVVNPAPANPMICDPAFLSLVDVLTPNEEEFSALGDRNAPQPIAAGVARLRRFGVRDVILTLGEHGCVVVTGSDEMEIPAFAVEAVDTVGAGDAFNGALAAALSRGWDIGQAARWACAAGAIAVTREGAQGAIPDRDQIDRLYRSAPQQSRPS